MYDRKLTQYDFFKPLNSREQGRMEMLWRRVEWLKEKMEQRDRELDSSSNLYRREYSALLWAVDYINAHNKKIKNGEDLNAK